MFENMAAELKKARETAQKERAARKAAQAQAAAAIAKARAEMERERAARVAADATAAAATAEAKRERNGRVAAQAAMFAVREELERERAERVAADGATATAQAEAKRERAEKAAAQAEAKRERAGTAAAEAAVMAGQRSMMLTTVGPLRDEVFGWKEAQGGLYKTMTLWSASEPDRALPPALKFIQEGWVRLWQVCVWCVACLKPRVALQLVWNACGSVVAWAALIASASLTFCRSVAREVYRCVMRLGS
jgi:hypothetical protein